MTNSTLTMLAFSFLVLTGLSESSAQSASFGLSGGAGLGGFYDLRKDDPMIYQADYSYQSGFNVAAFYQVKTDPVRFELQYLQQKAGLKSSSYGGHVTGLLDNDLQYTIQQLNLKAIYVFQPVKRERFQMNILAGMVIGYNFKVRATGSYPQIESQTVVNPNGDTLTYSYTQINYKDDQSSDDLTNLNMAGLAGLEFVFPVGERIDILLQNRYMVYVSNFLLTRYTQKASLLSGEVNVGVRFKLGGD